MTSNFDSIKIVIVGGVAGGATAAARARRTNANAEIFLLEKGPLVSFANCGLPYHIGGEIAERKKLLVATKELFWNRFRVDVRCRHEVTAIDRHAKKVTGIDHETGKSFELSFDRLILSTGSAPILPPFWKPAENVRHLWTIEDMDAILATIENRQVRKAVVVGAGFVGLEVAEQLHRRGIEVAVVQQLDQVLGPVDWPIAKLVEQEMRSQGIALQLSNTVDEIDVVDGLARSVLLGNGQRIETELVIVAIGVRPRVALAESCGLALGPSGGVKVNAMMQTSDPSIYAVGDMVEYRHGVTDRPCLNPLAGPANRAGRIAGAHAASSRSDPMGPVFGTAIVRVFDLDIACTGLSERGLQRNAIPYRSVIIQAPHHASYYPGAKSMQLVLHYAPDTGRILGAQAAGGAGIDKRIDVIATAMFFGATVRQLAQLDLSYAPPFGSAKDPVHMAAFAACNDLDRYPEMAPLDIDLQHLQVVDVRTAQEREQLPLEEAVSIPIDDLLERWTELDPTRETLVVCHSGKRAHVGACWLQGKGFEKVRNMTGGMSLRSLSSSKKPNNAPSQVAHHAPSPK